MLETDRDQPWNFMATSLLSNPARNASNLVGVIDQGSFPNAYPAPLTHAILIGAELFY